MSDLSDKSLWEYDILYDLLSKRVYSSQVGNHLRLDWVRDGDLRPGT